MNLSSKDDLTRLVGGCIRDAIRAHGPITTTNAESATKRVAGSLLDRLIALGKEACADAGLRLLVQQLERELKLSRRQQDGLRRNRQDLLRLLRHHGIDPGAAGTLPEESVQPSCPPCGSFDQGAAGVAAP